MLTENEAKQRWCPFARVTLYPSHDGSAWNRSVVNSGERQRQEVATLCIGSACMAWRWATTEEGSKSRESRTHGFCGLAGRPS